jgi:hypothetical protein
MGILPETGLLAHVLLHSTGKAMVKVVSFLDEV